MDIITQSGQLLLKIKKNEEYKIETAYFETISWHELFTTLNADNHKKTFWINIYNAYYQILAKDLKVNKKKIYQLKSIKFQDFVLSLDDIEHGILRKYRWKYSLGYLPDIFINSKIKKLAVAQIDYRIHFALNCGAVSCPPISFYTLEKIETQLDLATFNFLSTETNIDSTRREIETSKLLKWFMGDFQGKKGITYILENIFDRNLQGYSLKFKVYDWTEDLGNFTDLKSRYF